MSRPAVSDADLAALARGDRAAFRVVYAAYARLVLFTAAKVGLSPEEGQDVAQEAFLKLFERARDIRDAAAVKAWLVVTTRNLALDRLRAAQRLVYPEETGGLDVYASDEEGLRALWRHEADLAVVQELLEELQAEPGGDTLRLFYVEGLTAREIAAARGEAVSTVTTRLSRLRARLKDELARRLEANPLRRALE